MTASNHSAPSAPVNPRGALTTTLLAGGVLCALILAAYLPVIRAGFIWDDDANVLDNATLQSADGLRQMWFVPTATQQYYPLMYTSYWLEYQLWGLAPRGYHLTNVVLHALGTILVWRLLTRLQVPGAWLAAALFAVHPIEVESVAWITERKNVLSLPLAILALHCYLRFDPLDDRDVADADADASQRTRSWWYALSLLIFGVALSAKTVVVTLPAVILVLCWWRRGRISVRDVACTLPFFALSIAAGLATMWMETNYVGASGADWSLPPLARLLLAGRALWFYAGKLLWPHPIVFFYPRWSIDTHAWWQYLFPLLAVVTPFALWLARGRLGRGPLAAVLIFCGVLMPALGFFNIYYMRYAYVSDHFQYHASVALLALIGAMVSAFVQRLLAFGRPAIFALVAVVLIALTALSNSQARIYENLETLYGDTIAKNDTAWVTYSNYSMYLDSVGRYDEAINMAREALERGPQEPVVHNNLGAFLFHAGMQRGFAPGQLDEAILHLQGTLALDPDHLDGHLNLARALAAAERTDEALAQFNEVLARDPNRADAHFYLGNLLVSRDDLSGAAQHYATAVRLKPDYTDALHNLGAALFKMGQVAPAIDCFNAVLSLQPDNASARSNLAAALRVKASNHQPAQP